MHDILNLNSLGASLLYSLMGVIIFWICFIVIDKITPYNLWKNIVEDRNQALATVVAAMCISIAIIIAASIAG
jgi:putative membrane protein